VIFGGLATATAIALVIGGALWWNGRGVFETSVGEQRVVQLADGSSVSLDTDSRIHVRFENGERRIDLNQGQALFDVAHDAGRPFVVHAAGTRITAVGTVFEVRRTGPGVAVTLVSGVVDVVAADVAAPPRRMAAGQKTQVSARGVTTRDVNTAAETSWTTGRLIFTDVPLEEAVSEVNRYLTAKIEIDDPAIRAVAARMPTYVTLKDVKKRWGHGQEDVFPVAQFEKLWGDMTALPEVTSRYFVVPRFRGQQLKDVAQLDGWLRDGSAAAVEALGEWE